MPAVRSTGSAGADAAGWRYLAGVSARGWLGARARAVRRDVGNVLRHGTRAPRRAERIWVDPRHVRATYAGFDAADSGRVIGGDWPQRARSVEEYYKLHACRRHWVDGVGWTETGIFDELLERIRVDGHIDGLRTLEELEERYRALDEIFEVVRSERRLRTRDEVTDHAVRESGGILVHIGDEGQPIFGHRGGHRFVMALLLNLAIIPAQLGVVHPAGLTALSHYRRPPAATASAAPHARARRR